MAASPRAAAVAWALLSSGVVYLPFFFATGCRTECGSIKIQYPFGVDPGCGAPQFTSMFSCNRTDLFFTTPSGSYSVMGVDYDKQMFQVFDAAMSTCSVLSARRDFLLSDEQRLIMLPTPDTIFAIFNCSPTSSLANRFQDHCYNFSRHSCYELYDECGSFRILSQLRKSYPPCCFTNYNTAGIMTMNVMDCTHYTTVIDGNGLTGLKPTEWVYGLTLQFVFPDAGCRPCQESGGQCGFSVDQTREFQCLCPNSQITPRYCGGGSSFGEGSKRFSSSFSGAVNTLAFLALWLQLIP